MATETLRPNAPGDECNLTGDDAGSTGCSACPNQYDCVDEETADDGTTRIWCESATYLRSLFNIADSGVGAGTINKITLYFRVYGYGGSGNSAKGAIKSDTTVTETAEKNPYDDFGNGIWGTYTQEWAVNPADSQAWEWADIDALQIGIALKEPTPGASGRCTQLYVVVDYTVDYPRSAAVSLGLAPTASRAIVTSRTSPAPLGLAATASRAITITRSVSTSLGTELTVSRLANFPRTASKALGLATTASRALVLARSSAASLGLGLTVSRALAIARSASNTLGLATTASRALALARSVSNTLGLATTASRLAHFPRTASVTLGLYTLALAFQRIKRRVQSIGTNRTRGDVGTNRDISTTGENRDVEDF